MPRPLTPPPPNKTKPPSPLSLEGFINIDVHYAETLREWRRRFNRHLPTIKRQGFDDVFIRCWNYYLCYCEAGFDSKVRRGGCVCARERERERARARGRHE